MQGQIRKSQRRIAAALVLVGAAMLVSCASEQKTALVTDPDAKPEGMVPWNKQEKWETQSQMGNVTDRR
jgi:hypothetical protein